MDAVDSPEIAQRCKSALDIVAIAARQIQRSLGSYVSIEDLESCGREGLVDAARRFDASRRVPFRCYALIRVRGAMLDGVRHLLPVPRRAWYRLRALEALDFLSASIAEEPTRSSESRSARSEADADLAEQLGAMATAVAVGMLPQTVGEGSERVPLEDETPEEVFLRGELRSRFESMLRDLPEQEAELIRRHYFEGERFDHVSASLGLSKSWGSRLHRRAIERLAKRWRGFAP
ncbi:MAG: sigma-70 family RNA polymerase sigma factor [Polyangiaceae bacterium]